MNRLRAVLVFSVLMMLLFTACSGGGATDGDVDESVLSSPNAEATIPIVAQAAQITAEPSASPGESALPQAVNGEQIVAEVNGEPITLAQFQRAVDRYQVTDIASYDSVASFELERLIQQAIIRQAAARMGIRVTEEDINAEVALMREIMPDDIEWQAWLMNNRFISEAEFRQATFDALITQRVQDEVIALSGAMVPQVRARHILTETQQAAQAAYDRLQNGEDFATVAWEVSIDETTRASGGELGANGGFIVPNDLIVPEIAVLALSQAPGDISPPTPSILGWHVVETLEIGERAATAEELARESAAIFEQWLQEQTNSAAIQRYIE